MAAYRNIYQFSIVSQNGDDVDIFISKKNYAGVVQQRSLGRAPILKRERNGNILGTSLEIYAECKVDGEFSQLYTSSADEFLVEVYRSRVLLWTGFVSPELYSEPDIAPPYDVQIIATDGLGELKDHDYGFYGKATLRNHIQHALAPTSLQGDITLISSLSWEDDTSANAPSSLLEMVTDLSHLEEESCYDVLQSILTSLNACITQQDGGWMVIRESDLYLNALRLPTALFGSMTKAQWWPVGNMSSDIIPAKKEVSVVHENQYRENILPPISMGVAAGWEIGVGCYYSSAEGGWIVPPQAGLSYRIDARQYPLQSNLLLRIKARCLAIEGRDDVSKLSVYMERDYAGSTTYLIRDYSPQEDRVIMRWHDEMMGYVYAWDAPFVEHDTEPAVHDLEILVPLSGETLAESLNMVIGNPYPSPYLLCIYSIELTQAEQTPGSRLTAIIANGAREKMNESKVVLSSSANPSLPDLQYGILRLDGGVVEWHTPATTAPDLLSFAARDLAMQVALPRMRYRGKLNVPSLAFPRIPVLFQRDNTYYFLNTYSFDLLNSEMEVELISIPNAQVQIESEIVTELPSFGSGYASSSGGGGTRDIVIDDTLSIYSTNAIQNKAVATALNAKADAAELANKQDKLVSGTNIKTVNGESILGEGNIVIQVGEGGAITVDAALSSTSTNPVQNKVVANSINGINDSLDGINKVLNTKVTYVPEVTGMLSNAYLNPGGAITANQYGWAVRYRYIAQDCDVSYKAGKVGNIGAFISDTIPEIGKTYSLIGWGATTLLEGVIKVTGGKYFCSTYNVDSQANDVYVTATYRETTNIPERLNGIENDSAEYRKSTLASSYFLGNRMVDTMTRTRWHHSTDTKIGNFTPVSATADTITLSATDAACITRIVILACELQDKSCEFIYFTASSNNTITKLYDFGEDIDCRNIVKMQCLHDTTEGSYGIHLSPLGYRAMAKDILRQTQKVQQFSDIRFCGGWTAQFCKGAVNYTDTKVVDSYDNIVCEPLLDGVLTGGSNLCWMVYARAIGSTINARTCYEITQSSPNGATITFPIKAYYGFKGFVRVVCGRETDSTGLVVMSIKSNGELIKSIDIPNALDSFVIELNDKLYNSIDVEFSMPSASLTKLKILEITLHETYVMPSQYRPIDSSSVVAFFGSSNTQFPSLQVADNLCPNDHANAIVIRPNGTTGDGCGYLPKELARLSGAVVDNWGKSGEKTQYGLDKIAEVLQHKRYTHIILSFFGNDLNAGSAPSAVITNIRRMCEYARGCGCIPMVMLGYGSESPNEANLYALIYDCLTQGFDSPFIYTNSAQH